MRSKSSLRKALLTLITLGAFTTLMIVNFNLKNGTEKINKVASSGNFFIALAEEPQLPGTSFLEKEAGIAVYTNTGGKIDLSLVRGGFKAVEKETEEYIIGSIETTGDKIEDAHCYVNKEGWMIAYYSKKDPIAKMIDPRNLQYTKLEKGLGDLAAVAGIALPEVKYYDFRYPKAQKLMIITDNDEFRIKIPSGLKIYERSFCGSTSIDGRHIGSGWGTIAPTQLKPDMFHTVKTGALVLAYSEE